MAEQSRIQQGKFYHIQWLKSGNDDYMETVKSLIPGRIYRLKNGDQFRVVGRAYFKYTYQDIDNIRVMMEDYDRGTVQYNLCKRMAKAFKAKTPAVRFSAEEREVLAYTYYENEFIRDCDRETLRKVLNIKK